MSSNDSSLSAFAARCWVLGVGFSGSGSVATILDTSRRLPVALFVTLMVASTPDALTITDDIGTKQRC